MTTITRRAFLYGTGSIFVSGAAAHAAGPSGPVVLTVSGKIASPAGGAAAEFDMAMLEALPKTSFTTSSPWTDGGVAFEGVAVKDLVAAVGATGATLTARALNDYSASFPVGEAVSSGAIIAYKMNGAYMSIRDKGPLWIVYPFDDRPELKTETNYAHCVWQLAAVEFTD